MKRCPTCLRAYRDETLNFCLDCGQPLESVLDNSPGETLALGANELPPTERFDPARPATVRPQKPLATVHQQPARQTRNEFDNFASAPQKQRNTASVVVLTIVATLALLALGGLGAWLLLRDKSGSEVAATRGNGATIETRAGNTSNGVQTTGNIASSNTSDAATLPPPATPQSTATPFSTPQATTPEQPTNQSSERREVAAALEGWRQTMVNPDVDAHMSYYAAVLHTYYNATNVSSDRVRANVARAFSSYDTFDVRVLDLQIEVDPSGQKAVATFDKNFVFSRSDKRYAGSGLNKFWFEKIGGRWLITGEKDFGSR